jgi:protoporphyrinogen oxidase
MKTRVAILGAGPAGLGAAWQLVRRDKAEAVVLEQRDDVGGNAGSFELEGIPVDYGSHRLHPACHPNILADLKGLMQDDLLDRPRHGRIYLQGRWIHFPLKPNDLLLRLPLSFSAGVSLDVFRKVVPLSKRNGNGHQETFASVLEKGLGTTICRDFYFPYAKKIWGAAPDELSAIQARRRVSAGSLGKMARKALGLVPGIKKPGAGRFFYPQQGYGQISRSLSSAASEMGAEIRLSTTVRKVELGDPHRIEVECDGKSTVIEAQHVWSTVPITVLSRLVSPGPPVSVMEASSQITYRAMILIYLVVKQSQWTQFDAHYFPDSDIAITRLSEPKNYSARTEPHDRTVLCAELPCTVDDSTWRLSDEELGRLVQDSLAKCGLAVKGAILSVITKRLKFAYPIYRQGYEKHFALLDDWATQLEGVLTFGRQGLFAHDNTHHALAMAYAAVDCQTDAGRFDRARWQEYRQEFAKHVVED